MKIIGYTTGVFDLFHIGHLNILRIAKQKCDYLIVGVTTDELSKLEKGKIPVIPFNERFQIIESIKYVDAVIPQTNYDKFEAWKKLDFKIMFVGDDWKGTERWLHYESEFANIGVEICYLPYTKYISSSKIKNILEIE